MVKESQAWDTSSIRWKCRTRESYSIREAANKNEFDIPERNDVLWNLATAEMVVKKREIKF